MIASLGRVSVLRWLHQIGIPCWNCTSLCGFADHCLGCSANGTFKCKVQSAECGMQRSGEPHVRHWAILADAGGELGLRPHIPTQPGISAAVFVAVTGWPPLATPS